MGDNDDTPFSRYLFGNCDCDVEASSHRYDCLALARIIKACLKAVSGMHSRSPATAMLNGVDIDLL